MGSAIIFFCSENSPRKKLSEVFQKIFRSVSEACRNFTKPGLYETLEQFPFPRSVSEHFQRISPGAQKCFSGGGIFRFPKRSGRVSLGFRFDSPMSFQCDFQWWPVCCHEWQTKCPYESLQRSASRTTELELFGCEIARRVSKHTGLRFGCLVASMLGTSTILSVSSCDVGMSEFEHAARIIYRVPHQAC